jgi:hypothetical protein
MPVTILNRPYQGLSKNLLPVYNGLGFTLDSSLKTRSNFRYICEIYVDNNKVSELRHHPDISHDNKGVFEVGRVIENFIGYDIFLQSDATTYSGAKTNRRYYVSFGEEYSSANPVSNIAAYDATHFRLNVLTAAFKSWYVGSLVLIGGSNVNAYNGWGKIVGQGASYAIISGLGPKTIDPYYPNLYYYQAFSSNGLTGSPWSYKNINGTNFLTLKIYNGNLAGQSGLDRVFLYIGNTVLIKQTSAGTTQVGQQYYENTEFKITEKSIVSFGGQSCVMLTFDAPYAGVMPVGIIGNVVTKDNVVLKGQANTSADLSYAFNGALQYQEYLDWTPTPYIWSNNTTKFLSNRPDSLKTINVCSNEHWTLSTFGSAQASNLYKVQTETWSTTAAYYADGGADAATIPGLGATLYQRILIPTADANNYNLGDYAQISCDAGTFYGQVARKTVSGGNTYVWVNTIGPPFQFPLPSDYIEKIIAVKYWNAPVQTASTIQACGPKNYIQAGTYPEFTNGSCYKYFVRVVTSSTLTPWNTYSVQKSETYTFNISCDCVSKTKYKLMFLNPLGGWDFYTFDLGSNKSLKIEKSIYQKKLKEVKTAQNNKYTYSQGNRGRTTYDTKSTLNYIVRSNFLTQEKIDWLSWIYESSEVYWIDETNDKLHPITLTATDISIPNKENAGDAGHLYIYTIEFETSYDRTIQRGGDVEYTEQQINTYGVGNDPYGFGYNNQSFY